MFRKLILIAALGVGCSCDDHQRIVGPDGLSGGGDIVGSGRVVTQSRDLGTFHRVSFSGIGHLVLEQTGSSSLSITAEDNVQPFLVSEVREGTLSLGVAPNTNLGRVQPIEYRLGVAVLDELSVSGAASVDATRLDTDWLDVAITGATTVRITGRAESTHIVIGGASTYDAASLESRTVSIEATGATRSLVRVSERLTARVRIPASVSYIGNPTVVLDGPPGSVSKQ